MSETTANEPVNQSSGSPVNVQPDIDKMVDTVDAISAAEGLLSGSFFDSIEELLTKLVPANDISVKDCWGKETRLPSALPARRQIKVFRLFKEIAEMPAVLKAFDGGAADAGAIIDLIISVASDDDVAEKLGEAFSTAHPDATDGKDPLDVFPVEEILAGLIPFFVRFLHRSVGAMGAMSQLTVQK